MRCKHGLLDGQCAWCSGRTPFMDQRSRQRSDELNSDVPWEEGEERLLRQLCAGRTRAELHECGVLMEIASQLGRTVAGVERHCYTLEIIRRVSW